MPARQSDNDGISWPGTRELGIKSYLDDAFDLLLDLHHFFDLYNLFDFDKLLHLDQLLYLCGLTSSSAIAVGWPQAH